MCGPDKQHACELMETFMKDFEKKLKEAKKLVPKLKFVEF